MHQTWYRTLTDKKKISNPFCFYFPQICFPLVCLWVALILVLFSTNKKPSINSTIFGHNLCWVSLFKRIIISLETQPFFYNLVVQFHFYQNHSFRQNCTLSAMNWFGMILNFGAGTFPSVLQRMVWIGEQKQWWGNGGCIPENFQLLNSELSLTFPLNALQFWTGEHYTWYIWIGVLDISPSSKASP